jgi:hypothetical protein
MDALNARLRGAIRDGDIGLVGSLLAAKADADHIHRYTIGPLNSMVYKCTPLTLSVHSGCAGVVQRLLKAKARPSTRDTCGAPINNAILTGHTDVLLVLLNAGADVDTLSESGKTPLGMCVDNLMSPAPPSYVLRREGYACMMNHLIQAKACVDGMCDEIRRHGPVAANHPSVKEALQLLTEAKAGVM